MSTLDARVHAKVADICARQRAAPQLAQALQDMKRELHDFDIRANPEAYLQLQDRVQDLEKEVAALHNADTNYLLEAVPYVRESAKKVTCRTTTPFDKMFGGNGTVQKASKRGDMLRRYLVEVERDSSVALPASHVEANHICTSCNVALVVDTHMSTLVCPSCGLAQDYIENSERNLSYDQEQHMSRTSLFCYKRINHMNDWLNSVTGMENTEIDPAVLEALRAELRKNKITNSQDITVDRIKKYLKKLRFVTLYEHAQYITLLLNGQRAPVFSPELRAKIIAMFNSIQEPFDRYKMHPDNMHQRVNSMSYAYLLHKICQLLGEDWALPYFNLLKCPEKLFACDRIWRMICNELRWEFFPSV